MSGADAGLIVAAPRDPELGFVGDVTEVNPTIVAAVAQRGAHPGHRHDRLGRSGQAYNINADTVAGAIAEALGAEKLVYLTDIEGLRRGRRRPGQPHPPDDRRRARRPDGRRHDRRRDDPEGRELRHAVRNGVQRAHILDGRIPHVLLLEIFTDAGIGTMVSAVERSGAE